MSFRLRPPASFLSFQFRYPCCRACKPQHLCSCLIQFLCYLPFSNLENPRISGILSQSNPSPFTHNIQSQYPTFSTTIKRHARRNLPVSNTPCRLDDPPLASFPALKFCSSIRQEIAICRFWENGRGRIPWVGRM